MRRLNVRLIGNDIGAVGTICPGLLLGRLHERIDLDPSLPRRRRFHGLPLDVFLLLLLLLALLAELARSPLGIRRSIAESHEFLVLCQSDLIGLLLGFLQLFELRPLLGNRVLHGLQSSRFCLQLCLKLLFLGEEEAAAALEKLLARQKRQVRDELVRVVEQGHLRGVRALALGRHISFLEDVVIWVENGENDQQPVDVGLLLVHSVCKASTLRRVLRPLRRQDLSEPVRDHVREEFDRGRVRAALVGEDLGFPGAVNLPTADF